MSIDKETARKVAHLARIEVAEEALEPLAGALSNILDFMEQLNEVDIDGVEPMTSVTPMALKRREDVVTGSEGRDVDAFAGRSAQQSDHGVSRDYANTGLRIEPSLDASRTKLDGAH